MKTIETIVEECIPISVQTILKESRIQISEHTDEKPHFGIIAVIGFSGHKLDGAVGFAAEESILIEGYGEANTPLSDGWVGEIANQLLGRLKNALLAYGVEVQIAIPMVLHGLNLQVSGKSAQIKQFKYSSKFGHTCVWVDANWDMKKERNEVEADQHAKAEGDMMLF